MPPMSWVALRLRTLSSGIVAGVRRFPMPLAAGVGGAVAGIVFLGRVRPGPLEPRETALVALMTSWCGVALFLGAALVGERSVDRGGSHTRSRWRAVPRYGWSCAAAVALAGCYLGLRGQPSDWQLTRFVLWLIAAHALLALAPRVGPRPRGDFRAFNLMLFSRTALALLVTQVFYAGLSFALLALEHLFDFQAPDVLTGQMWFVILGVFNTAYALAGVPRDWDRLGATFETPRVLDLLARHVLLPLSVLYLAILYVYSAKIIFVREWPRGWVSAPIIVFAALGLLTVLLLEPERSASRFVRAYCRGFFVALLPLVVLLVLAISRRAFEYGLTEERCLVYAVGVFLGVVAPYFLFSRVRELAFIPLVMAVIALLASVGPLSALSLSLRSQTSRLHALLVKTHRLEGGILVRGNAPVSPEDEVQISAALNYLGSRQALDRVAAWRTSVAASCTSCVTWSGVTPSEAWIMQAIGLTYRPGETASREPTQQRFSSEVPLGIHSTGFDWVVPDLFCYDSPPTCSVGSHGEWTDWKLRLHDCALAVERGEGDTIYGDVDLQALCARAQRSSPSGTGTGPLPLPLEAMTIEGTFAAGAAYRLQVSQIAIENGLKSRVKNVNATLLVRDSPSP
jgi:Domain of unknown function (DUF4153)